MVEWIDLSLDRQGTDCRILSSGTPYVHRNIGGAYVGRILRKRNVETPVGSTEREYANRKGGITPHWDRRAQEAKASSRKVTGIHNRLDRAIPNLQRC